MCYINRYKDEETYTPAVYFSAAVEATEHQRLWPQLDPEADAMQGQKIQERELKQIHILKYTHKHHPASEHPG